jgi:hypothetical protein
MTQLDAGLTPFMLMEDGMFVSWLVAAAGLAQGVVLGAGFALAARPCAERIMRRCR